MTTQSRTTITRSNRNPKPSNIIKIFTRVIFSLLFVALGLFLFSVVFVNNTLNPFGWAVVIVYVLVGWVAATDTCNS